MLLITPLRALRERARRRRTHQTRRVRCTCARALPLPRPAAAAGSFFFSELAGWIEESPPHPPAVVFLHSPPPPLAQERGVFLRAGFPIFGAPPRRSVVQAARPLSTTRRLQPRCNAAHVVLVEASLRRLQPRLSQLAPSIRSPDGVLALLAHDRAAIAADGPTPAPPMGTVQATPQTLLALTSPASKQTGRQSLL